MTDERNAEAGPIGNRFVARHDAETGNALLLQNNSFSVTLKATYGVREMWLG